MQPSCYLLESADNGTTLYLGEVSTVQCLSALPAHDPVEILEIGATGPNGEWIDRLDLPEKAVVVRLIDQLERSGLELIDFAANIGPVRLSTHDDGEAELRFRSEVQSLHFLRTALAPDLAEAVIRWLVEHPARYVTNRNGSWQAYATFEAYLAAV